MAMNEQDKYKGTEIMDGRIDRLGYVLGFGRGVPAYRRRPLNLTR